MMQRLDARMPETIIVLSSDYWRLRLHSRSIASFIDGDRLWKRHMDMALIGPSPNGGSTRLALTQEDIDGRLQLAEWAKQRKFQVSLDAIGNMFVRREGTDPTLPPVMTGSHLDTQPQGGRFDGVYGVLAGFEVLEALDDAAIRTRHPIDVAVWTNEEGARFWPGCMGSKVFADPDKLEKMRASADTSGITVAESLSNLFAAFPDAARRQLPCPVASYIEAHIEQGPVLEIERKLIGVVTGIQGTRRFRVEVTGFQGHAGTVPADLRKDAVRASANMIAKLQDFAYSEDSRVRFTVGRIIVEPNAPAVIPGHVTFTIDFRHPELSILDKIGDRIALICEENAGSCDAVVHEIARTNPTDFAGTVPELIEKMSLSLQLSQMPIYSGAGHDAENLARLCPAGMIFVPCENGISHNEKENVQPGHLEEGAKVLADVILTLAKVA